MATDPELDRGYSLVQRSRQRIMFNLERSLSSGEYSDLKIVCKSETFDVHKMIVCPQSEFFSKKCKATTSRFSRPPILVAVPDAMQGTAVIMSAAFTVMEDVQALFVKDASNSFMIQPNN
ncbi:hypothetical protein BU24DRAFT_463311 [Aaosphaeria arxii CBS 175.79]|uniref:BTB domain-containing protein n=1 Tax=Aaosphaeria arxii CBS 175.79 TaxID=1450172 RepID=A0A6A5XP80_9PLEO|nr:uncharacterized protein BU24DRAFT_463311 [Aaosphaeria arxii CBS 175.79]KAF2014530.1 hypothetical protein BU24DRAFT_463311 [Aaosphaeria arxii CBS 175.79]